METTFITIHDLTLEARILYSSNSIIDILGHTPDEIVGKPCWDFFHPDEIPFAKDIHSRGVKLDKAAVLAYCQIRDHNGAWVGCECCFSIVYDVMVCCTSVYRRGITSQRRAVEAPIVRKLFSSSPEDPRYHMLSHLSAKFELGPKQQTHEPRAALFLNRFTRTLTIMYATGGIEHVIGISSDEMRGKSFYYCIQENSLENAVRVLETAKGNDSIAYLRFQFRDPRARGDYHVTLEDGTGEAIIDATEYEDGLVVDVADRNHMQPPPASGTRASISPSGDGTDNPNTSNDKSRTSSHESNTHEDPSTRPYDSSQTLSSTLTNGYNNHIELEAVVSCTSDGLVVCLRRARPLVPPSSRPPQADRSAYPHGIFAAPWATEPVFLPPLSDAYANAMRMSLTFESQQSPIAAGTRETPTYMGHASDDLLQSIRDVAVFAWALTGINGSLCNYCRGTPMGDSQPPGGLSIRNPRFSGDDRQANSQRAGYSTNGTTKDPFGDPGLSGRRFGA